MTRFLWIKRKAKLSPNGQNLWLQLRGCQHKTQRQGTCSQPTPSLSWCFQILPVSALCCPLHPFPPPLCCLALLISESTHHNPAIFKTFSKPGNWNWLHNACSKNCIILNVCGGRGNGALEFSYFYKAIMEEEAECCWSRDWCISELLGSDWGDELVEVRACFVVVVEGEEAVAAGGGLFRWWWWCCCTF